MPCWRRIPARRSTPVAGAAGRRRPWRWCAPETAPRVGGSSSASAAPSPRLDALDWAPALDSQSHVEHDAAVGHASDGVEVGLDDLGDLAEQQGEAQDQLAQRLTIERRGCRGTRPAGWRRPRRSRSARRLLRPLPAAGGTQPFRPRPAWRPPRPTASTGPRSGSLKAPDQHVGAGRHEALDDRSDPFPSGRLHPSFELAPTGSHRRLTLQPEQHGVDVARMRGSGKVRLQRHRSADFLRRRNRALEIAAAMRGGNRDPVRGQQSFCVGERKPAARGLAIKK